MYLIYDLFMDHDDLSHTIIISQLHVNCSPNALLVLLSSSSFLWHGKMDCIPYRAEVSLSVGIFTLYIFIEEVL